MIVYKNRYKHTHSRTNIGDIRTCVFACNIRNNNKWRGKYNVRLYGAFFFSCQREPQSQSNLMMY